MITESTEPGPPKRSVILLVAGAVLIATFLVLKAFRVYGIGGDADIGGGFILLAGLILALIGRFGITTYGLRAWRSGRRHRL